MTSVKKHETLLPRILVTALMTVVLLAIFLPLMIMLLTSFKSLDETTLGNFRLLPGVWRFENFSNALSNSDWGRYYANTAYITVIVVILSLLFSSLAGFSLARLKFKGNNMIFLLFLAGIMIPPQAYIIPQYIILRCIPFAGGNNILGSGGTGWLNSHYALIFPFIAAPVGVFLCKQFYSTFPKSLDEAATIDGCSAFRIYVSIYLPMSKPIFATFAILKFSYTWNDFFYPLIMINSSKLYTVQIALQKFRDIGGVQWNYLMAATIISILPIMLVFVLAQKYFIQGIVTTGIK